MRSSLKSLFLPALLTGLAFALLVSLGNWQLNRLAWKEDLIARAVQRPVSEPLDFRARDLAAVGDPEAFLSDNEYRPVRLAGTYAPDGEVRVFTALTGQRGPYGGPGYWVLTPFVTEPSGAAILVNRGFVPDGREDAYEAPPAGAQEIEGLIRSAETGSAFTPDPKLDERIFFSRNPAAIAAATGLAPAIGGFFVDLGANATPPSGLPQAGETRMSFPNSHLEYAITWFGLAAALLAVFGVFVSRRLKEPQAARLTPPGERP